MRKWRRYLDEFVLECDWKDVTLIKICACMFGVMLGMRVPQQRKKAAAAVSAAVFLTTTGLMAYRLIRQCCNLPEEGEEKEENEGFIMRIVEEE